MFSPFGDLFEDKPLEVFVFLRQEGVIESLPNSPDGEGEYRHSLHILGAEDTAELLPDELLQTLEFCGVFLVNGRVFEDIYHISPLGGVSVL